MAAFLRPLSTAMLCAVMVLGHAPAWLHIATCEEGSCGAAGCHDAVPESLAGRHECDCHDHHAATHAAERSTDATASLVMPSHDSGSCAICHSLATPCGFADALATLPTSEAVVSRWLSASQLDEIPSLFSLPPSRGPPAILA